MDGKSLRNIFGESVFIIPDYQRGYSWQTQQLDDLWSDIECLSNAKKHYTGTITIKKSDKDHTPYASYEVVDGQQRLTTLFILISQIIFISDKKETSSISGEKLDLLRHKFIKPDIDGRNFLFLQNSSEEKDRFFQNLIAKKLTVRSKNKANSYERNLIAARDYFINKLQKLSIAEIEVMFSKVANKFVFNVTEVSGDFEVCAMFESINYRGKKITVFEGLKNRLIYICELISNRTNTDHIRNNINYTWSYAYNNLGKGEKVLDEDVFLLHHTTLYFGSNKKGRALDDIILRSEFSIQNIEKLGPNGVKLKIENYIANIQLASECWAYQKCSSYELEKIHFNRDISEYLGKIKCIDAPSQFQPIILASLMSASTQGASEDYDLESLLDKIERYCFIVYNLLGNKTSHSSKLSKLAHEINSGNTSLSDVTSIIIDELEQEDTLINRTGYTDFHKRIAQISHARFMKSKGWRDWPALKYLLLRYEKVRGSIDYDRFIIAHEELEIHSLYKPEISTADEKTKHLTNDIGNYTLVAGSKPLINPQEEIIDRGVDIIEFMFLHWDIPRDTFGEIIEINPLEFLSKNIKIIK